MYINMQSKSMTSGLRWIGLLASKIYLCKFQSNLSRFFLTLIVSGFFSLNVSAQATGKVAAVFVLDQSGSVADANFLLERDGFKSALSALPTNSDLSIAVIYFDSSVTTRIGLTVFNASGQVALSNALTARTASGGTATELAINSAKAILDTSSAKTKFIFLSTDGEPNNASAATAAANAAKSVGIAIEPIGIGLSASGKTFLDSISSSPPTPNPGDFGTFGIVVKNKILAAIGGALNVSLVPASLSFGVVSTVESSSQLVKINNNSDDDVTITGITVSGRDKESFIIKSVNNKTPVYPIVIRGKNSIDIAVVTKFYATSSDGQYNAALNISTTNGKVSDIQIASLKAKPGDLQVEIFDATAIATNTNVDGVLFNKGNAQIDEFMMRSLVAKQALGLVSDGNSRLLIRVKSNLTGIVNAEISSGTSAKLWPLDISRSVGGRSDGATSLGQSTVAVENSGDLPLQSTFIAKAGYDFSGSKQDIDSSFKLTICLKVAGGSGCAQEKIIDLKERRAPVLLLHGLWADDTSFANKMEKKYGVAGDEIVKKKGLLPILRDNFYQVSTYSFDGNTGGGNEGPSLTMGQKQVSLANAIENMCEIVKRRGFACTRSVLVGHSMGGLVARKFVYDNENYKRESNFKQGAVAKLITMGTPHNGSPFADLLRGGLACVDQQKLPKLIALLSLADKQVSTAIDNLRPASALLKAINTKGQEIYTFGFVGDVGVNTVSAGLGFELGDFTLKSVSGCVPSQLFGGERTDGIVPVSSAQGKLQKVQTLSDVEHVGMGKDDNMTTAVLNQLQQPTISGYDTSVIAIVFTHAKTIMAKLLKNVGNLIVTAVLGVGNAYAADTVQLTVDNANPVPGATIRFTAVPPAGFDSTFGVLITSRGWGITKNLTSTPYSYSLKIGDDARGAADFTASVFVGNLLLTSNIIKIAVNKPLVGVVSVKFESNGLEVLTAGLGNRQLGLSALLAAGTREDIEPSQVTFAVTGIDGAASDGLLISSEGLLTGVKAGEYELTATVAGKVAVLPVSVRQLSEDLRISAFTDTSTGLTSNTAALTGGAAASGAGASGGGGGGGCTAGAINGDIDPVLYFLMFIAMFSIFSRSKSSKRD